MEWGTWHYQYEPGEPRPFVYRRSFDLFDTPTDIIMAVSQQLFATIEDRVTFSMLCPKRHRASPVGWPDELHEQLENDSLEYFCMTCGVTYQTTATERADLKHRLEDGSLPTVRSRYHLAAAAPDSREER